MQNQTLGHPDFVTKYLRGPGTEIGAFLTPIPGITPIYVDRFAVYADKPTNAEYYGDACNLPFNDSTLQYVASSHVIEHVANPIQALREWSRVLQHGGIIYMVVPDRRRTFDHHRALTAVEHIVTDFRNGVGQSDGTHIDEFLDGLDWDRFAPSLTPAQVPEERERLRQAYRSATEAGHEINIHFHTFEDSNLRQLVDRINRDQLLPGKIELLELVTEFPANNPIGVLVVARIHKPLLARVGSLFRRSPEILKKDAKRLSSV